MAEMNWIFRTKQDWMANMSNIWRSWMDLKCFLGTIGSVLMHDGVVEGGTGELNKEEEETEAHKSETAQSSAKKETIAKDTEESEKGRRKKKILITGSGSYVGTSVEAWLKQWPDTIRLTRWI